MNKATGLFIVTGALGAAVIAAAVASADNGAEAPEVRKTLPANKTDTPPKQLWHCGMHPQVIQDHPGSCPICHMALTPLDHAGRSTNQGSTVISIDPAVVQNMGVRTAKVTRGPLNRTLRAVGMFMLPESGMHEVNLRVGGWIEKLYADQEGMHVVQGEPLFDLYSPDMQLAEQELITAIKTSAASEDGKSLVDSAKRKLQLWGVADEDIDTIAKSGVTPKTIPIRSPATGHVEEKAVVQGSAVSAMTKVMRVADHTKMWLEAQVYQEDVGAVRLGMAIRATVDGMPGRHWDGTITFIHPHVDHMSRTLAVRMTVDNADFTLKPGMYATAEIMTTPVANALLVQREAVIDTGTKQIVFLDQGDGHFAARSVRMGAVGDDGMVEVAEGLAVGDVAVTSGQFLIDAESRTVEAIAKLSAAGSMPATMPATAPVAQGAER